MIVLNAEVKLMKSRPRILPLQLISGVVLLVGMLVGVHSDIDGVFDVGHDEPLKALCDYWGEGHGNDNGCFHAG